MYLETFKLPINKEDDLLRKRAEHNGGPKFGYIDNPYPCGLFAEKELHEIHFQKITIFYGGNGSGKSTLLNLISDIMRSVDQLESKQNIEKKFSILKSAFS